AARSRAFSEPEIIKELGLSKDQQEKIAGVQKDYDQKQQALFAGGGGAAGAPADFQAIFGKVQELNDERDAKATEVLNKGQQEKSAKLKGKPSDLAQLMQMGPGGRGGRGGPAGRPQGAAGRPQNQAGPEKKSE